MFPPANKEKDPVEIFTTTWWLLGHRRPKDLYVGNIVLPILPCLHIKWRCPGRFGGWRQCRSIGLFQGRAVRPDSPAVLVRSSSHHKEEPGRTLEGTADGVCPGVQGFRQFVHGPGPVYLDDGHDAVTERQLGVRIGHHRNRLAGEGQLLFPEL